MATARIGIKVTGGATEELMKVGEALRGKIARKAIKAGCDILVRAEKSLVTRRSGLLARAIGDKVVTYESGITAGVVGARSGFKTGTRRRGRTVYSDPTKYDHLVEGGTKPHSLATRVNRHMINSGQGPWLSSSERQAMLDADWYVTRGGHTIRRPGASLLQLRETARQRATAYFARRDAAAGKKVHPGAKAKPFARPAAEQSLGQVQNKIAEVVGDGVREATL